MPKPSTTPFTWYTFRYDIGDDKDITGHIVDWLKTQIGFEWVLFEEISDKTKKLHLQGKVGASLSNENVRARFKEQFPFMNRSNYSLTHIKTDNYDSYIAKDGKLVSQFTATPFTKEYIQEQVEKHQELKKKYDKADAKIKGRSDFTYLVATKFIELYPNSVKYICAYSFVHKLTNDEKDLYDKACKMLLGYLLSRLGTIAKVFDDCILQRMYNGIKNCIINLDDKSVEKRLEYYSNNMRL